MALKIICSARFFKTQGRCFNKITSEFNPPSYWVRLKVLASGQVHRGCVGTIRNVWNEAGRGVRNFDPLILFWISEPPCSPKQDPFSSLEHYKVDIAPRNYELAGLLHVRLPKIGGQDEVALPDGNLDENTLPDIRIDHSKRERKNMSKVTALRYGVYFFEVVVVDELGNRVSKVFKVWAYPSSKKCKIRPAYPHEKLMLFFKSFLPSF